MHRDWAIHSRDLLRLHESLLAGDRLAGEELAQLLYLRLVRELGGDSDLGTEAVGRAWLAYVTRPAMFDASRGVPLDRFLLQAARADLSNLKQQERRRKRREGRVALENLQKAKNSVADGAAAGNLEHEEESTANGVLQGKLLAALPEEVDRRVFILQLKRERKTEAFAEVLGVGHLPVAEQRAIVKRVKDRIGKVLRRLKKE